MEMHSRRLGRAGGMPAVLAHCFLGHGGAWKSLVDALPTPLDAEAPDLPGHGRSPMPQDPGDFHAEVSAALGALVTRPSLLIGHSFGAACLLRHALYHPQSVTGLVLIEPVFFAAAEGSSEYTAYREVEGPMQEAAAAGRLDDAARLFLALNPGSPDFDTLPEPVRAGMAAQMALVAATPAGLFDDSGALLDAGRMEGFDTPVLILLGSQTTPIFPATQRGLLARLPRASSAVIPGAGHMAPITHAHETATAIAQWMTREGLAAATSTEGPEKTEAPRAV